MVNKDTFLSPAAAPMGARLRAAQAPPTLDPTRSALRPRHVLTTPSLPPPPPSPAMRLPLLLLLACLPHSSGMERVAVELPGVPSGLTVYVTRYLARSDVKAGKGELQMVVGAFDGVCVGKPRYAWKHPSIFMCKDAGAAIEKLVAAYPEIKLSKAISNLGPRAAEPPLQPSLGKRKPQQHVFFSPEPKMPYLAQRARREHKWQDAQHSVSRLISAVVKKTVPQLEGLNKRLCAKLGKLKAELKSANMSNSGFQKAKGKAQSKKKRRNKAWSDASVTIKPRNVKEAAADLAAAVHTASDGVTEVGVEVLDMTKNTPARVTLCPKVSQKRLPFR